MRESGSGGFDFSHVNPRTGLTQVAETSTAVAGWSSYQGDPFDSGSGYGRDGEGPYNVTIAAS